MGALDVSVVGVADYGGNGGVGPSTTQLNSQIVDCCIDSGNFMLLNIREYSFMSHSY